jgi:hypothetical protein
MDRAWKIACQTAAKVPGAVSWPITSMFPPTRIVCLNRRDRRDALPARRAGPHRRDLRLCRAPAAGSPGKAVCECLRLSEHRQDSGTEAPSRPDDIAADLIRRGLDLRKRDLDILAALGRAFGYTNMGVYAEVVAGAEIAVGDALLMNSGA